MHWVNRTALVELGHTGSEGEKWRERERERGRLRERRERLVMIGWWFKGLAYLSSAYWEMGMGILGGASQWPHTSYIVSLNRHLLYILPLILPQCNESIHPSSICQSDLCILHKSYARRRGKWNHLPCPLERILLVQSMYGKGSTPSNNHCSLLGVPRLQIVMNITHFLCIVFRTPFRVSWPFSTAQNNSPQRRQGNEWNAKNLPETPHCRFCYMLAFVSSKLAYLRLVSLCVQGFSI